MTNPKIRRKRAVLARTKNNSGNTTVVEEVAEEVVEEVAEEVVEEVAEEPKPKRRRKKATTTEE